MHLAHCLRRMLQTLLVCSALALPGRARAEPPGIVIFGPKGSLSQQIQAELATLGFRALSVDAGGRPFALADAHAAAREAGAVAAIYVVGSHSGVEVWLVDRVTGKTSFRDVVRTDATAAGQDRIVAVRVVELLRASLLELELPEQTRGEVEATSELRRVVGLRGRSSTASTRDVRVRTIPSAAEDEHVTALLFDAGFGVSSSIGAVGLTPVLALGAFWQPTPVVGVGLSSRIPVAAATVSEREGTARITTWDFVAGSRIYPFAGSGPVQPSLGLGLGVLWFQIEGTAAESRYTLASEQLIVAGPHADVGVRWQLSRRFALRSSFGASHAFTKPLVQFAGRQVLTLGRPLVAWTLGIEFRADSASNGD